MITKQIVAEKIADYLHRGITLGQLVDWAEHALLEGKFDEHDIETLRDVIARLGVADVRAFGLTWDDCEHAFSQLLGAARHHRVLIAAMRTSTEPRTIIRS